MNKFEINEEELRSRSLEAEIVDSPIKFKNRENLESIVSMRFSGYELAILKSICKKQNKKLSTLLRELISQSLAENENKLSQNKLVENKSRTFLSSQLQNKTTWKSLSEISERTTNLTLI